MDTRNKIIQKINNTLNLDRIERRRIAVTIVNGGDDNRQALLKKEHAATGAGSSFCWAVAVTAAGNLELQLQVLPASLAAIMARQELVDDSAAVVVVKRWDMAATLFNGAAGLNGPQPVLFTEQPKELRSRLRRDPDSFLPKLNEAMAR
jgi:hypothetical protein